MEINDMRSVLTLLAFITFIGIVLWAYHTKSRRNFDEAAQLPFADDDLEPVDPRGPARHK